MMNGMDNIGKRLDVPKYAYSVADIKTVIDKSAEDIAESLEIMMVETRAIGDARDWLRGACCLLRGEPTQVTPERAAHIVGALRARWIEEQLQARIIICERAIAQIEEAHAGT